MQIFNHGHQADHSQKKIFLMETNKFTTITEKKVDILANGLEIQCSRTGHSRFESHFSVIFLK